MAFNYKKGAYEEPVEDKSKKEQGPKINDGGARARPARASFPRDSSVEVQGPSGFPGKLLGDEKWLHCPYGNHPYRDKRAHPHLSNWWSKQNLGLSGSKKNENAAGIIKVGEAKGAEVIRGGAKAFVEAIEGGGALIQAIRRAKALLEAIGGRAKGAEAIGGGGKGQDQAIEEGWGEAIGEGIEGVCRKGAGRGRGKIIRE